MKIVSCSRQRAAATARCGAQTFGLDFRAPAAVQLVGSYPLDLLTAPDVVVDVAVQLPGSCLQKKDHLNYR